MIRALVLLAATLGGLLVAGAAPARAEVVTISCAGELFTLDYDRRTVTYADGFRAPIEVTEQTVSWTDGRRTIGTFVLDRFSGEWRTHRPNGRPLQPGTCQVGGRKF